MAHLHGGVRATRTELAIVGLFVALAAVFCARFLLPGRTMMPLDLLLIMGPWRELQTQFPEFERVYNPMLDPVQQYFPWQHYWAASVHGGEVPLWNPDAFAGTPFLANLQSAVFYPGKLLFLVLPTATAFGWTAFLHLALAGWFTYLFVRSLGAGRWGGVIAGVAYAYCGYTVGWLAFPTLGQWVCTWLPLLLFCYTRALQTRHWGWVVGTAVAVALQFLGGHLQVSFYVMLGFVGYIVFRLATGPRALRGFGMAAAASALGIGVLLASAQLLPTLELAQLSPRAVRPLSELLANVAVPWSHLVLVVVPNFFGNPVDFNYWGDLGRRIGFNFYESGMYVGAVTLLLAAWAVYRRRASAAFFALLVAGAVLLATGSPLFVALYHLVPGYEALGGLGRALVLACFGLAVLAGLGADDLVTQPKRRAPFVALLVGGMLLIGVSVVWVQFGAEFAQLVQTWPQLFSYPYFVQQVAVAAGALGLGVGLVALRRGGVLSGRAFGAATAVVLAVDLFWFGVRFPPAVDSALAFPPTPLTRHLQQTLGDGRMVSTGSDVRAWFPPNTPMMYGLADIQGSDSLWWRQYAKLLRVAHPDAPTPRLDVGSPILDRLSVTRLVTFERVTGGKWQRDFTSGALHVYRSGAARPRGFVTRTVQVVSDDALAPWLATTPWSEGVAVARPLAALHPEPAAFGAAERLTVTPHHVEFTVSADAPALAVLADPLYPGWRVRVDGAPAEPIPTDGALRGVVVPKGTHTVVWKFHPASYVVGLFLSGVGLLMATALFTAARRMHVT